MFQPGDKVIVKDCKRTRNHPRYGQLIGNVYVLKSIYTSTDSNDQSTAYVEMDEQLHELFGRHRDCVGFFFWRLEPFLEEPDWEV